MIISKFWWIRLRINWNSTFDIKTSSIEKWGADIVEFSTPPFVLLHRCYCTNHSLVWRSTRKTCGMSVSSKNVLKREFPDLKFRISEISQCRTYSDGRPGPLTRRVRNQNVVSSLVYGILDMHVFSWQRLEWVHGVLNESLQTCDSASRIFLLDKVGALEWTR